MSADPGLAPVDCGIIVVTYNSAGHIEPFLDSIPAAAAGLRTRCLVVDNQSTDATQALVSARPEISLIDSGGNLGYSGAINVGRGRIGPCASVMIVNPDLELEPGSIAALHAELRDPTVGVAVPMMVSEDGEPVPTLHNEPTVLRALGEALFGDRLPLRPPWLSETIRDRSSYRQARDVDWASGALLCISAECNTAVGEWDDTRFFLYSEETDFAARVRRLGYRLSFVPAARARHESGGSGRPAMLDALGSVNRIRYYEKYHGRAASTLFRATVMLKHILRAWDPDDRLALRYVCRRPTWADLPGGRAG
jgi:N-acetylglucosaminyl-diphospho-decaprenol L-rhamnosyltransferase